MRLHLAPLLLLLAAASGWAFPEGAPWDAAGQEGCAQCHFDAPAADDSAALAIEGLPPKLMPGASYRVTVRLTDRQMVSAGFLLSAWRAGEGVGTFVSLGSRTEVNGAMARSTEAGTVPVTAAVNEWVLDWQLPAVLSGPVVLEVWANAANDDQSPFGDATHRRAWQVPVAAGGAEGTASPTGTTSDEGGSKEPSARLAAVLRGRRYCGGSSAGVPHVLEPLQRTLDLLGVDAALSFAQSLRNAQPNR